MTNPSGTPNVVSASAVTNHTESEDFLTADEILSADDILTEIVHVPEWSNGKTDKVLVKGLTASERDDFESSMIVGTGKTQRVSMKDVRANLVQRTICQRGADGKLNTVFNKTQIAALGRKSASAMDRVYAVAARLSKISNEDVEELVGKSDSTHTEDSSLN